MKRILIIGATSAIATACARRWVSQGNAHFFLIARNAEHLTQTVDDLKGRGARVDSCVLDVGHSDAHESALIAAIEKLGHVDIALIAHGTLPNQTDCERDASIALREFFINANATIGLLTLLANQFEKQKAGTLAVITSVAGVRGRPSNYLYGSAKAAVSAFCEGLRARLHKSNVALVDIRPGFVDTPMTHGLALPRFLVSTPETVAVRIVAGLDRRADVLYVPAFWALIMWIIRHLPRFIFKKMTL